MSKFLLPVQEAVYTRLTNQINSATIYDDVPALSEGQPEENFPFIVVGQDYGTDWDTDDTLGGEINTVLHIFSRYEGNKQVKQIMQDCYNALHRKADQLTATGYRFVDCIHEFTDSFTDSDGRTRHGVCRFIITVEEE